MGALQIGAIRTCASMEKQTTPRLSGAPPPEPLIDRRPGGPA
jgi:hypothetical protein